MDQCCSETGATPSQTRNEGNTEESEVLRAEGAAGLSGRPVGRDNSFAGVGGTTMTAKTPKGGAGTRGGVGGMSIAQRMAQRAKLTTPAGGGAGGSDTPPRTAESHVDGGLDEGDGPDADVVPDMPPSWVPKLSIPRDAFDMRCPRVSTAGQPCGSGAHAGLKIDHDHLWPL